MSIQNTGGNRTSSPTERDRVLLQAVLEILAEEHSARIDAADRIRKLVAEHFNPTSKRMFCKPSLRVFREFDKIASLKQLLFARFKIGRNT
jgi:hypothetical protein